MQAQAASWQSSTHDSLGCVNCHRLSFVSKNLMLAAHFSVQQVYLPFDTVNCLSCHKQDRVITPAGDLKVPHEYHMLKDIACQRCHPATGHLNLTVHPASSGTNGVMGLCLKCHYNEGGTLDCKDCHRDPPLTSPHLKSDWLAQHGNAAEQDVNACNACHKYTLFLNYANGDSLSHALSNAASYAQDNAFCANCHRLRPSSHTEYFAHDHPILALAQPDSCEVCHSFAYPLPTQQLPALYCQKCHAYKGWVPVPYSQLYR